MKIYKKILSFVLIFMLLTACSACSTNYYVIEKTFFNTSVYIATDKNFTAKKQQNILDTLSEIENSLSLNNQNSFVSKFNNLSEGESLTIPSMAKEVLIASKNAYNFSNGAFNPSTLTLLKSWKLSSDTFQKQNVFVSIPTSTEIENGLTLLPYFGTLDFNDEQLVKPKTEFEMDLGGIAKGFAVDKIVQELKTENISKGYVSIGGSSIYIYGTDDNLSVIHPRKSGEYILSINKNTLKNICLSTSGDYIRFYLGTDGKRYSHIINTKTGYPIDTGFASITVIGKTATETDAISTSLCSMTKQEFLEFVKTRLTDCKVYAVYESDKLILTNASEQDFTLLDNDYAIEYIC